MSEASHAVVGRDWLLNDKRWEEGESENGVLLTLAILASLLGGRIYWTFSEFKVDLHIFKCQGGSSPHGRFRRIASDYEGLEEQNRHVIELHLSSSHMGLTPSLKSE